MNSWRERVNRCADAKQPFGGGRVPHVWARRRACLTSADAEAHQTALLRPRPGRRGGRPRGCPDRDGPAAPTPPDSVTTPAQKALYQDGQKRPLSARRHVVLPRRRRRPRSARRLRAPDLAHRLEPGDGAERLERHRHLGRDRSRQHRLVPQGLQAPQARREQQLDPALRVGQLPRDGLPQRQARSATTRERSSRSRSLARAIHRGGVNRLVVRVDSRRRATDIPPARDQSNGRPGGGWWNYGGLLREVYLRRVHGIDIENLLVHDRRCAIRARAPEGPRARDARRTRRDEEVHVRAATVGGARAGFRSA